MADERFKPDPNFKAGGVVGGYAATDAIGAENPTLIALRIDATTGRLLVDTGFDLVSDGDAVVAANDGVIVLGSDGSNYQVLTTDSSGHLQVDVLSGGGGGVEYTEGDVDATITGSAAMMEVAANTLQPIQGTVADGLLVNLGTNNDVTVAGTVDLGATDNAVLDAIESDTTTIAGDTTSIDGKLPALGQALAAASIPVVLTAAQVTTLTPPAAITGFATSAKQDTIIGHVDGVETLLGTIDADTSNISTKIDTVAGAVSGTEMQVDVLTMPTTTVQATNLDIRDLTAASDSILVKGFQTPNGDSLVNDVADYLRIHDPDMDILGTGADASANSSNQLVTASFNYGFNGTSWDMLRSDTTYGIDVDVTRVGGSVAVTNAGITTVAGAVSGTEMQVDVVAALPAGTNAIGKLAANSGVDIGDVDVTSIAAGTNAIGNVGVIPRTTGGLDIFRSIDIDESEEEVKAAAGQLFSISAFNTTAAPLYLKFYNATAANTTVGTTTPVLTFVVPGNADSDGAGFVWNNDIGLTFGTAISVACTTGVADADTGAPGANACIINIGYK